MNGEMLGIVGRSGAGKTTLVNLISRLYDVNEGEIRIDGIPVKELGFRDLRRKWRWFRRILIFLWERIAENIAYANPDASREDIIRAAVLASAHDLSAICRWITIP